MTLPQELTGRKQFVLWGMDKLAPKKPYSPKTLSPDNWTDPDNWGTYAEAMHYVKQDKRRGLGFAFNGGGIFGIDLDNVFIDGKLIPEAQEIVDVLDSFTECSMSGKGLHIYVNAPGVDLGITKKSFDFPGYPKEERRHIEFYQSIGYFAMTLDAKGNAKPYDNRLDMSGRSDQLNAIYVKYSGRLPEAVPAGPTLHYDIPTSGYDERYLQIGLEKDQALIALWNGERPSGNESNDDLALMNKLAYWTNRNEALMYSAALSSPYYVGKDAFHSKKWGRDRYMQGVIKKAVSGTPITAKDRDGEYRAAAAAQDFKQIKTAEGGNDTD